MENLPSDPFILLSFINMKLRDEHISLKELCDDLGIDSAELERRLGDAGFVYDPLNNRFG